ncbi:MAG: hypothetical protein HY371_11390, partial [Devosia nanyangense]|nr:hypothetical protein [Devosia nanyangense]
MPATATAHVDIDRYKRSNPELFSRPLTQRLRDWSLWLAFAAALLFTLWWIDANPMRIVNGLSKLGVLVRLMVPPWPGDGLWEYCYAMFETLAMAFLGTIIAAVLAVPFTREFFAVAPPGLAVILTAAGA